MFRTTGLFYYHIYLMNSLEIIIKMMFYDAGMFNRAERYFLPESWEQTKTARQLPALAGLH